MDHGDRLAEIMRLRSAIAAGSRAVSSVHCALACHLEELGRSDEAIAVYRNAARIAEGDGLLFHAYAIAKRLVRLAPDDDAIRACRERVVRVLEREGIAFPPGMGDAPRGAGADIIPLTPAIERRIRDRLQRCGITTFGGWQSLRVVCWHEGSRPGSIATSWFAAASYAVEVDDGGAFIPCGATVIDAQAFQHALHLVPIDPDAGARIRSHPCGLSNVRAIHIGTGADTPHRVRNVFYSDALAPGPAAARR